LSGHDLVEGQGFDDVAGGKCVGDVGGFASGGGDFFDDDLKFPPDLGQRFLTLRG
jgi:hypothetical protein